jgi:hypothetical protein
VISDVQELGLSSRNLSASIVFSSIFLEKVPIDVRSSELRYVVSK